MFQECIHNTLCNYEYTSVYIHSIHCYCYCYKYANTVVNQSMNLVWMHFRHLHHLWRYLVSGVFVYLFGIVCMAKHTMYSVINISRWWVEYKSFTICGDRKSAIIWYVLICLISILNFKLLANWKLTWGRSHQNVIWSWLHNQM